LAMKDEGEERRYWGERLAGAPGVLEIPTDRPRSTGGSPRREVERAVFSGILRRGVERAARREGTDAMAALLAGLQGCCAGIRGRRM